MCIIEFESTINASILYFDHYVVFYDDHNDGEYNETAKWIAKICCVSPTGYFIICRKKWFEREGDFKNEIMDKSIKELQELFKSSCT